MILKVISLSICTSIIIDNIPFHKTPPSSTYVSSSVYDQLHNEIITIGGVDILTNTQKPNVFAYSLTKNQFYKIEKLSDYEPTSYAYHRSYLRHDRKILNFGYNSGVVSFSLVNRAWSIEVIVGDELLDLASFGFTDFILNNTVYVALFGGVSEMGVQNSLYL